MIFFPFCGAQRNSQLEYTTALFLRVELAEGAVIEWTRESRKIAFVEFG